MLELFTSKELLKLYLHSWKIQGQTQHLLPPLHSNTRTQSAHLNHTAGHHGLCAEESPGVSFACPSCLGISCLFREG